MIPNISQVTTSIPIPVPETVRESSAPPPARPAPAPEPPAAEPPPPPAAPSRPAVALSIGIHDATGQVYLQLVDARTREILRSVPPQEVLEFRAALSRSLGLFLDTVA